jgi:hypothetical protein
MNSIIKNIFFRNSDKIKAFSIIRIPEGEIAEKVYLKSGDLKVDITGTNSMICLDPFCMAAWLPKSQAEVIDLASAKIHFIKGTKLNALIVVSLIETIDTPKGSLLLFKIEDISNHQLSGLHRQVLFKYFLRSKNNTYHSRKVISALYSYPRSIIIVSYQDDSYCNIFPMDIHGYIEEEGLYLLGLRTTNVTLDKILGAKKVVICDTDTVDIDTVYTLGKHSSTAPTPKNQLPFKTHNSELFGFPVPDFAGSYKEVEIINHKKMGYHMLMIGKVLNQKNIKPNRASLYHLGFLQYQESNYKSTIDGLF